MPNKHRILNKNHKIWLNNYKKWQTRPNNLEIII